MRYIEFIGGSYQSQAVTAAQMDTVNWYEERIEDPGGSTRRALYPTPGAELIVQTNSTDGRAHIFAAGREFSVIGANLIEIDIDGVATARGTVAVNSNPATISWNGDGGGELFITSGTNGYAYNLGTNTLTQVTALNGKATMGAQLDGYFLALDAATGTMYASALLDGLTWSTGTMFIQRSSQPDPWVAMAVKGQYIYLLGSQTGDVLYNSGASPFPFAPHPSGGMRYGIVAPFSLRECDDSLLWLGASKGGRGYVLRATGFSPEVVSNYAMQYAVSQYTSVADGIGDGYSEAGHTFYLLHLPTANATWAYDLQMSAWHKRGTWVPGDNKFSIWRLRYHVLAFDQHRWLHGTGTGVYRTKLTLGTDVESYEIRRLRRAPALEKENLRITYPGFELDLEPGLGTVSGQGLNPTVMLRASRDGGKTWGPERQRSAGKMGEYTKRIRWNRCGSARKMVFEVSVSDPTPYRLTNAYLTPDPEVEGAEGRVA